MAVKYTPTMGCVVLGGWVFCGFDWCNKLSTLKKLKIYFKNQGSSAVKHSATTHFEGTKLCCDIMCRICKLACISVWDMRKNPTFVGTVKIL